MNSTAAPVIGRKVYVASTLRYFGRGVIESIIDAETVTVRLSDGRLGKVNTDQIFAKAAEAKANATDHIIWNR
jgi:hypothetical protein